MDVVKTFQYKLKPTPKQEAVFGQWVGVCRFSYNICLDYKKTLYDHHKISIGKNEIQKELKDIAKETEWINCVHSQTLQDVTDRLYLAYDKFFKGSGFPKFAKKDSYNSFAFKQGVKVDQDINKVYLPKIGWVRYRNSRPVEGNIKTTKVVRKADGWYVSFSCKVEIKPKQENENHIGIDMGTTDLAVLDNDEKIANPRHLQKHEYKLRRLQRSVSRKKKGGSNRRKAIRKLSKQHLKIKNSRKDNLHKISTRLVRENQSIAVEKLQIRNMVKNHHLAQSISDASWGMLADFLEYKCGWYGKYFDKVNPRNTSKTCSSCGYVLDKLPLHIREWKCPGCGTVHDRDVNAAKNIKARSGRPLEPGSYTAAIAG